MVVKTKIITARDGDALDDVVNAFIALLPPNNVISVQFGVTLVGQTSQPACFIVYQQA